MILDTSILAIGSSCYVRIPASMVEYFKIREKRDNKKCKIEDTGDNRAELTFQRW
jgi:hypothetical protein